MNKFTQEIKDKWLEALKSGDYKQGYGALVSNDDKETRHCCIGVLGEVHPELENVASVGSTSPYNFLMDTIGASKMDKIWSKNDNYAFGLEDRPEDYKDDYSNVIPLIEQLEVQE